MPPHRRYGQSRRSERSFGCPSTFQPEQYHGYAHVRQSRPLGQTSRYPVECHKMIVAFVSRLLATLSPSAIVWRVWSVVVDTFDGVLVRWSRSHVGVERFKRHRPAVAHEYPTTAIVVVGLIGLVAAPLAYARPRLELSCVPKTVSSVRLTARLVKGASTGSRSSTSQIAQREQFDRSASAPTGDDTHRAFGLFYRIIYHGQSTVTVTEHWDAPHDA